MKIFKQRFNDDFDFQIEDSDRGVKLSRFSDRFPPLSKIIG